MQESLIERAEFKTKNIEHRLRNIEQKIEQSRMSMRIDPNGNEKLLAVQKKVKDSFSKQSELHAKIIRGLRRKDQVEKYLQSAQDKETRY